MLALLKHDLLLIKKQYLLLALMGIISFVVYATLVSRPYVFTGIALFYIAVNFALQYEDKYNFQRVLASLPFDKRGLVLAKFLSVFVMAIIGILISAVMGAIVKLTGLTLLDTWISINDLYAFFIVIIVYIATIIPLYYKFGYAKMRYYGIFLIVATAMLFIKSYDQFLQNDTVLSKRLQEVIFRFDGRIMYLVIIAILIGVLFISITCSKRIISKKEY